MKRSWLVWGAVVAAGCGGSEPRSAPVPAAPASADSTAYAAAASASVGVADAGTLGADASAAPEPSPDAAGAASGTGERFPGTAFPPADFEPPHARSAKAGDGKWIPLGTAGLGDRVVRGPLVMVQTKVHPHTVSRFMWLTVAAMDLRHLSLGYVPGKQDTSSQLVGGSITPGLVPEVDHDALLVVFNGGFLPRHGLWGMMAGGETIVPPRDSGDGCVVAIYRDGRVRIRPWAELASATAEMVAYRQTPPCLLADGELHRHLPGNPRPWGGLDKKRKTRRRSALGVDASGRILLYGMGEEVGAHMLAQGMKDAGAVDAAQLDINWSWTRFLLFGEPGDRPRLQVTNTLIPKMVHGRMSYVSRKVARDFFYVKRRE